ncbi:MAG: hypothetical protein ACOY3J_03545 [Bacillota bacterium]|uniref:Uncharacterized protein n=1 Tax=Thermanaerosceptrum fracticalcis TaxID=1712410 RepID=A0A7G6E2C8_THEFR|nr:hypothetical protein [Thermanaerosceptrum fracticalcis]QNB46232.1 hypothetical protein BR63_07840 [Thermanaerosceptrum fracticalcis]
MSENQEINPAVCASTINSLPPGALALERFKLALSLSEDTSPEAVTLRQQLMEEESTLDEDNQTAAEQQVEARDHNGT